MRLTNYEYAENIDKKEWLNSIKMSVGLPYFGGKSVIGRYILNNIFNLAVEMKKQGKKADIFIDGFTGGGKIGLSIPKGWFDTIVINDLNYGVYSYYKCCQEDNKYIDLIYMIERIGKEMSKDFFHLSAYTRSFGEHVNKWGDTKNPDYTTQEEVVDPLVAGALTYWVTSASYNNMTAPDKTVYKIEGDDRGAERANIDKIVRSAYKRIPKLHEKLNNQQYIIENLDYRELIKKYNGKDYIDITEKPHEAETKYTNKNKLWYFDPPYHPYCLSGTDAAPYADTFPVNVANEMIDILHGDREDEFGAIDYFIKSDYDPAEVEDDIEIEEGEPTLKEVQDLYKKIEDFPFCKICVGSFDKGAVLKSGEKSVGQEYIWCKGFPEGYDSLDGEPAKDE